MNEENPVKASASEFQLLVSDFCGSEGAAA